MTPWYPEPVKYIKPAIISILALSFLGLALVLGTYFYIRSDLPSVDVLKDVRLQTPMRIYTQDGHLISQYGVKRRIPLNLSEVPPKLIEAVLATEDSRFYDHPGVDPIGMLRALVNLVLTGEKGQGGSTLTMQMARDFFLTRDKTYIRKIREIIIAWHMEQLLSKDEILELYLNKVELGHRAFGFGAAAQVYYGKTLNELNLAQIATLAGLPQAPSVLNPISRPDRALARRRIVLLRMLDEGYIKQSEFDEAVNQPITAVKHGAEIELDAPYLADMIYNEMIEIYGKDEAETGGYQVFSTVPSALQVAAQKAVQRNLHDYDERHGYHGPVRQLWGSQGKTSKSTSDDINAQQQSAWSEQQMLTLLNDFPTYETLHAAIVVEVNEQAIKVFDKDGVYRTIDWDGLDWARPFINDNKQGPDPKQASDILQAGALILIRQREDDQHWQLAQYPQASGALVALDPHNGAVQSVVGGYSFYQSQFNRATQAKRQVGSNIKPFIYSAALEHGYTLASIINDAPITQWEAGTGTAWRPENSPPEYDGPIRLRVALTKSKNVVSVRLVRALGLDNIIQHLSQFGFDKRDIPNDETVALGSGSHTPMEVVTAMATIANGGFLIQPHFIQRIEDDYGKVLWQADPLWACEPCEVESTASSNSHSDAEALLAAEFGVLPNTLNKPAVKRSAPRVISAENAYLVAEMMHSAVSINGAWDNRGTGWRTALLLQRDDVSGKTGTTNDVRDTWFSGFTPDLVATTWVGFDDNNRRLGKASRNQNLVNKNPEKFNYIGNAMAETESGAVAAQPAWIRFMQEALDGVAEKSMPMPTDLVTVRIDKNSGKLTERADKTAMFEYFVEGTEPQVYVAESEIKESNSGVEDSTHSAEDIF
jgi:penicillin-binding protein 1A